MSLATGTLAGYLAGVVAAMTLGWQIWKYWHDNRDEEIGDLQDVVEEQDNRLSSIESQVKDQNQYLYGFDEHEDDSGAIGEIKSTLGEIQASQDAMREDMDRAHGEVYSAVRELSSGFDVLTEVLHDIETVADFDKQELTDRVTKRSPWSSDD